MEEKILSVRDIAASVLRRWKPIAAVAVVCAVLLGGAQGFLLRKEALAFRPNELAVQTYEQELLKLNNTIQYAEQTVVNEETYLAGSLWMQINPYNKHVAQVYLSVSNVDEQAAGMSFGQDTTPLDYLLNSITTQYEILWSAMNLSEELALDSFHGVMDKYLRELVEVQIPQAGVMVVTAVGSDAQQAAALADAAANALMDAHAMVQENSFAHSIAVYHTVQNNCIDTEMAAEQEAHHEKVLQAKDTILNAKKDISKLKDPSKAAQEDIFKAVLKFGMIGGLAGALLTCAWYCVRVLLLRNVLSSNQMERVLAAPFLGTTAENKGAFIRLSNLLAGERTWKRKEEALRYLTEAVKLRGGEGKILLTSTLDPEKCAARLQLLQETLSRENLQILCEGDNTHNPAALAALNQCDGVVFVETVDHSRVESVGRFRKLAEEFEKPVIGFVLI